MAEVINEYLTLSCSLRGGLLLLDERTLVERLLLFWSESTVFLPLRWAMLLSRGKVLVVVVVVGSGVLVFAFGAVL